MNLIVACDPTGGIGYNNSLPWEKIENDLARFKKLTTGQTVVMGRKTYDSLPKKPLPNRLNIVLTTQPLTIDGVVTLSSIPYDYFTNEDNVWIIGGAMVINSYWDRIKRIHLTRTFSHYKCDTHIDLLKLHNDFSLEYEEANVDHVYEVYSRKY